MGNRAKPTKKPDRGDFDEQAALARTGLLREFWDFLRYSKKWWLVPVIVVLLLVGVLIVLSSTAVAPLIYTFF